jgi:hypothetical protein
MGEQGDGIGDVQRSIEKNIAADERRWGLRQLGEQARRGEEGEEPGGREGEEAR